MTIIEIEALSNGAHRNQTSYESEMTPPEGWAIIPEDIEIPSCFPFVDIQMEDGVIVNLTGNYEAYKKAIAVSAQPEEPTQLDRIEAQAAYTALMTDTLLEV